MSGTVPFTSLETVLVEALPAGFNDVDPLPTVNGVTFAGHHTVSQ